MTMVKMGTKTVLKTESFVCVLVIHCQKNFWTRVLGSVVIQLYAGGCTPSVDRTLGLGLAKI